MNYIDTHCDTAFEMFKKKEPLSRNSLHISLEAAQNFEKYAQIMAIWSQNDLSNGEGWSQFAAVLENLKLEIEKNEKDRTLYKLCAVRSGFFRGQKSVFSRRRGREYTGRKDMAYR